MIKFIMGISFLRAKGNFLIKRKLKLRMIQKSKKKFKRAFTLIELAMVVVTLGIIFTMVEKTGSTEKFLREKNLIIVDTIKQSLLGITYKTNNGLTGYSLETFKHHPDNDVRNLNNSSDALKLLKLKDSLIFQESYYNVLSFKSGGYNFLEEKQYEREGCEDRRQQVRDRENGILQTPINYNTKNYVGFGDVCKLNIDKESKKRDLSGIILKRIYDENMVEKSEMFIFQDRSAKTEYFIGTTNSKINSHWINFYDPSGSVNSQIVNPELSKKIYLEFGEDLNINHCTAGDFYDITIGFGQRDAIKRARDKNLICLSLNSSLIRNFIFK